MKHVAEVTACVIDYGTFTSIAEKLAETMAKVYYHTPYEAEYQNVRDAVLGTGLERVERLDDPLDKLDEIDLFVFPDIGYGSLQRHLRNLGKAVWGHMGADELELYRDHFLDVLHGVGLPIIHAERIFGVTQLAQHLRNVRDKWVKINRYRGNMETWHHIDYANSLRTLESMAVAFGGAKEQVVFIVQDAIEAEIETGYDGWSVGGQYPLCSFQGYEKKNELYLGSLLQLADLPEEIRYVNDAMAPVLESYGYRGWWATEIRIADGTPYFIDPTPRMPGQTGEHQTETLRNFADVIWQGANGILIEPRFTHEFAAEATLHFDSNTKDPTIVDEWKTLRIPEEVRRFVKLYHYFKDGDLYHFPIRNSDEIGVVIGRGDDTEGAIEHLHGNLEVLEELPLHADIAGFADLLREIKDAEAKGIKFGGRIPKPESILAAR